MSGLEMASGKRTWEAFPADWGIPPGARDSEERARWVAANVRAMQLDPYVAMEKLNRKQARRLNDLRRAQVAQLEHRA